jgi:hypothetical protein
MEEDVVESADPVDSPEPSVEVVEEPAGEAYTVNVDGETQEVSLQELRDGYQRQADYTRKTQELASERKRLQQAEAIASALENDPESTLKALGDAFGVQAPVVEKSTDTMDDWDTGDATTKRLNELEAKVAQQDRLRRKQVVEKQVEDLKKQYGDFDSQELFQHAMRHKIGNLEAALTHMRFEEVANRASKLEQEQDRLEAKRDAAVVEPGGSRQSSAVSDKAPPSKVSSLREAFNLAKKQHTS